MAIGDVSQVKLYEGALSTTATNQYYTNISSNYKTTVTSITILNTNTTTTRYVSVYIYGSNASNQIMYIPVPANGCQILTQLDYVLSNTDSIYFKQDTGTDANIAVMGITEQIA